MSADAELQILRAVRTTLSGIPINISKGCDLGRTDPIEEALDLPRFFIGLGDDDVVDDGLTYSDNQMQLIVTALVRDLDDVALEELAALRAAAHAALTTNRTLGLSDMVIDLVPAGSTRPERLDGDRATMPPVFREFSYQIRYRTKATDRTQGGA